MPHSAKSSRQRTRRQRFLCRVPHIGHSVKPLPIVTSALGKKKSDVNSDGLFAECHLSGTRQRIFFFENSLLSAILLHSAKKFFLFKKKSLPSAMALALGKAGKLGLCFPALSSAMVMALGKALFAECGTRQRGEKCYFLDFCFPSAQTKKSHIYQHTAQDISHTHPYSITYTFITHHIHIHHP